MNIQAPPPHDEATEEAVLGAVLMSDHWLDVALVDAGLTSDDFYRPRNQTVFSKMVDLQADSQPIDTATLCAALEGSGQFVDGLTRDYVEALATKVPSLGNTRSYAMIIKENSLLRSLVDATHTIQDSITMRSGDPRELIEQAQATITGIGHGTAVNQPVKIDEALMAEIAHLEQIEKDGKSLTGTPSGFAELDALTGGFQPNRLIVLAARPSMGKSVMGGAWAVEAARAGFPTLFVSLEMEQGEIVQRLLAAETNIHGERFRTGTIGKPNWRSISNDANALGSLPLWIEHAPDLTVLQLRTMARRLDQRTRKTYKRGLGLIVVDYLQLLTPTDRTRPRPEQVGDMSKNLKAMAGELQVPVVAVSQLNRAVDARKPPRPVLSDLKDSGSVEQDADMVAFIYRDEYYKREKSKRPGTADLIVAKHRNGGIKDIELGFAAATPKFLPDPLYNPEYSAPVALPDDDDIDQF